MKFLFDLFPILLFFIAYKMYDIYMATIVIIAASIIQVSWFWFKNRRVEKMHIVTLVLVLLLGGATLFFQDATFIYWKPTVVNWIFAVAFFGSQFIGEKTLLQRMLDEQITVTAKHVWVNLNMAWVIFFIFMGAINLYVAFNFEENTWVNFKLFGMMGLTFVFVFGQGFYLAKYITESSYNKTESSSSND